MKSVALPYRLKLLQRVAKSLKMEYQQWDHGDIQGYIEDFELYKRRGVVEGIVKKEVLGEYTICIFDYYYDRYAPYDSVTTGFFVHCKELALPEFLMEPETFFHRVAEILGREDFDFEAFPKFSQQYFVGGDDEERVRNLFTKKLLRRFTLEKNYTLEGVNYYLLFYRMYGQLKYHEVLKFYRSGMKIYNSLKQRSK